MGHSFLQKLMLMIAAGFAAAVLLYLFRHVVNQALWESSDEGWRESTRPNATRRY